ncbi:zinc-binding dehydrogenase, partial [Paraburkholderia phenazinium]|uniref:zinc-binding dehydrogenase n=1 Tax=Paraburkholderia phenazinium TaxID=60549 RepID=UPI00158D600C
LMSDGAGVVEAVGEGVTEFQPGDAVVSLFFPHWVDGAAYPAVGDFAGTPGDGVDGFATEVVVRPAGATVLTLGTGGVSIAALQIARAMGATVIVTSSSDEKLEKASALGAHHTINYRQTPAWGAVARELTGGRGVDHVLELGGP